MFVWYVSGVSEKTEKPFMGFFCAITLRHWQEFAFICLFGINTLEFKQTDKKLNMLLHITGDYLVEFSLFGNCKFSLEIIESKP